MSVMELTKNKKYKIEVVLGYNGKKRIRYLETFYGKKSEAKTREFELGKLLKNGLDFQRKNMTIKDLSEEYFKYKQDTLEKKTYINYQRRLKLVMKQIGYVKVKDINVKVLENFYHYLRHTYVTRMNKPLGPTIIQYYYQLVNNMLEYAIKCDYRQDNPNKPKRAKPKPNHYDVKQTE